MKGRVLSCSLCLAALVLAGPAWAAKVKVCHVPPDNPANFHTITVSENALQAHLGHGDLPGACFAHCEQLCDDGDACTIDACDASEQCQLTHPPVSCDDGNLCTIDSCDPTAGCASTPKACQDGVLCTVDSCDPLTGNCAFPPIACPNGQECNASNGSCENTLTCPCLEIANFAATLNGTVTFCLEQVVPGVGQGAILLGEGFVQVVINPGEGLVSCASAFAGDVQGLEITVPEAEYCIDLIHQSAAASGITCTEPEGPED